MYDGLHYRCTRAPNQPILLLESGYMAPSCYFTYLRPSKIKVCSFDKTGVGYSRDARDKSFRGDAQNMKKLALYLNATFVGGHSRGGLTATMVGESLNLSSVGLDPTSPGIYWHHLFESSVGLQPWVGKWVLGLLLDPFQGYFVALMGLNEVFRQSILTGREDWTTELPTWLEFGMVVSSSNYWRSIVDRSNEWKKKTYNGPTKQRNTWIIQRDEICVSVDQCAGHTSLIEKKIFADLVNIQLNTLLGGRETYSDRTT